MSIKTRQFIRLSKIIYNKIIEASPEHFWWGFFVKKVSNSWKSLTIVVNKLRHSVLGNTVKNSHLKDISPVK